MSFRHRWAGAAVLLLAFLAGCGDGAPTGTPSPGVTVPATLAIVAGDGQSAAPGAGLPQTLSVLVRNGAGTAVSGVSVLFSVDSGGGTIAGANATTGTDGVATSGTWTIGVNAGPNVVSARVGSLPVVKFRSTAIGPLVRTLINRRSIPNGGGTITYNEPGDPLNGLTISIPALAYTQPSTWTITADSVTRPTLPTGFAQVGPTLTIDNAQGYADSVITLSMPLAMADSEAVAPFYFDAATSHLEPIPLVERSNGLAVLATRHFSRDLLALPGVDPGVSAARIALVTRFSTISFGSVKVVWIKTPKSQLVGTYASGFVAGTDNWEFVNNGSFVAPHGDCEGMSITAMHYWYFLKGNGQPSLFHRYDTSLLNQLDNVQGMRYAGSVQADYSDGFDARGSQERDLIDQGIARGTKVEDLTASWIVLTLKLLKQPVLLGLLRTGGGHAVVAYAATTVGSRTTVSFADPNLPLEGRTMVFENGILTPVPMALSSGKPNQLYQRAYALAVTADVPMTQVSSRWREFTQKAAGADRYPAIYRAEYLDQLTNTWQLIPDTLATFDSQLVVRHVCPSCKTRSGGAEPTEQSIEIWDESGEKVLPDGTMHLIKPTPGANRYWLRLDALTDADPTVNGFVDAKPLTVIYSPVDITKPTASLVFTPEVWTVSAGALVTPGTTFTWLADDGSSAVVTTVPSWTYTPQLPGVHFVTLTIRDASAKQVARVRVRQVSKLKLSLTPSPAIATRNVPTTLTLTAPAALPLAAIPGITFQWIFQGPSGVSDVTTTVPTVTRTFSTLGAYEVSVAAFLPDSEATVLLVGSLDFPLTVTDIPATWKFTSFNVTIEKPGANPWLNNPTIGSTDHFTRPETLYPQIQSNAVQGGLLYLPRDTTFATVRGVANFKRRGFYFVDSDLVPLTTENVSRYLDIPAEGNSYTSSGGPQVRANWFMQPSTAPNRTADTPLLDESFTQTGSITEGSFSGTYWKWQGSTFKGNGLTLWFPYETRQLTVQFNGAIATGTITIISRDFDHTTGDVLPKPETKRWTIRVNFTAERLQ